MADYSKNDDISLQKMISSLHLNSHSFIKLKQYII